MAISDSPEKRRAERIPSDRLPQPLRRLHVSFGAESSSYHVETIDASRTGISFRLQMPIYSIRDYNLTIKADDASFTLRDELVYAKPLDLATSRVSVHFTEQPGLADYAKLLDSSVR